MFLKRFVHAAFFNTCYLPRIYQVINPSTINMNVTSLAKRLSKAESLLETVLKEIKDIKRELSSVVRLEGEKNLHSDLDAEVRREKKRLKTNHTVSDENDAPGSDNSPGFLMQNDYVMVYTDGACENNGKPNAKAGIGVFWGPHHRLNVSEPVRGRATNNTAEIQACVKAVELAVENSVRKLIIKTDSQFVINSMTKWIKSWKKKNWTLSAGGPVKNKEDFQKLDIICTKLVDIKWEYTPGHSGLFGNEEADRLAREGALRYTPNS